MGVTTNIKSLPALPTVWAVNMYAAQGVKLGSGERAAVVARADFFQSIGLDRSVTLKVVDPRTGERHGSLTYTL